jgi:Tfp pilus assembly protein PilO
MAIAAIAVLTAIGLVSGLFIWPNYRKAFAIREQITELRGKLHHYDSRAQEVSQLEAELSAFEHRITHELKAIPDTHEMAGLTQKLSQHVDRVQVMDQAFTTGTPGEAIIGGKSSIMAMPLTVDMEAKFDSVFALLKNAESIDRLVRIVSVKVSCKRDENETRIAQPLVKASIGLEAIFDPPSMQVTP